MWAEAQESIRILATSPLEYLPGLHEAMSTSRPDNWSKRTFYTDPRGPFTLLEAATVLERKKIEYGEIMSKDGEYMKEFRQDSKKLDQY